MKMTIKKASLRGQVYLSYSIIMIENNVRDTINRSSEAIVHQDLVTAFRNLIPFFAHYCEEITDEELVKKAIANPEEYLVRVEDNPEANERNPFLRYTITGIELGGSDDSESIQITGYKWLKLGETISFTSPKIKFEGGYKFANELRDAVELIKSEVYAFMEGKVAPTEEQASLFGDDFDNDENQGF